MAAAKAPQAKIRPDAKNLPSIRATGVNLFHNQDIIEANVHTHFPLMASQ